MDSLPTVRDWLSTAGDLAIVVMIVVGRHFEVGLMVRVRSEVCVSAIKLKSYSIHLR